MRAHSSPKPSLSRGPALWRLLGLIGGNYLPPLPCLAAWAIGAIALFTTPELAASPIPGAAPGPPPAGRYRDATLDQYRAHLMQLIALVDACAKARDLQTCDPLTVGPDDRIPLGTEANPPRRLIRYGWLRVLFSKAEEPDQPAVQLPPKRRDRSWPEPVQPPPPSTSKLLEQAKQRIAQDLAQTGVNPGAARLHEVERATMREILAGRDFQQLEQQSVRDALLEKLSNWLNRLLDRASRLRARSAWLGSLIVWGFITIVCLALIWALLQLERRWRVRLVPEDRTPAPSAASARAWQAWLEDARSAATAGQWREAIHFLYWAAISRLESRRLWPADRARTPREYLALVAPSDPRKNSLAALTGSFERTWYGGRPASENEYRKAEEIASALIAGGAPAEGGAR